MNQEKYIQAVENPPLRRNFIKSINLEEIAEYVSKISFSGKGLFGRNAKRIMSIRALRMFPRKSKIQIYPRAFDLDFHPNFDDFCSSLIHHEGYHAREIFERDTRLPTGSDIFIEWDIVLERYGEIRALKNQIEKFSSENSKEYIEQVRGFLESEKKALSEMGENSLRDRYLQPCPA
jgi:hypothetical protein